MIIIDYYLARMFTLYVFIKYNKTIGIIDYTMYLLYILENILKTFKLLESKIINNNNYKIISIPCWC